MIVMNSRDQIGDLLAFFDLPVARRARCWAYESCTIGQWRSDDLAPRVWTD